MVMGTCLGVKFLKDLRGKITLQLQIKCCLAGTWENIALPEAGRRNSIEKKNLGLNNFEVREALTL